MADEPGPNNYNIIISRADMHEIGVHEVYRGVSLYAGQADVRLAEARAQVDAVVRMRSPRALAAFACDASKSPEARLLAKRKALASLEQRQKIAFDVDGLSAATIGLERRTSRLARLMGFRRSGWWPRSWLP